MANRISEEVIEQICSLYKEYGNKTKVANELNISISTVTKYLNLNLNEDEINELKCKSKINKDLEEQINSLYKEYRNISKVAKELNVCIGTVRKYLSDENRHTVDNINDDQDALWYYIIHLFGVVSDEEPVSKWNLLQMQKFRNQGMPYKGQLLTLKYFYEVKKASVKKANGSIGIIPFIYADAKNYYESQAKKADEINEMIKKQLKKDKIEIAYNPDDYLRKKKKKKKINIDEIGDEN